MTVFTKRAVDVFAPATAGGAARGADMGEAMVWGTELERANDGAMAGRVDQSTWAGLAAITGARAGQPAIVYGPDAGTHTDPVVGGTVANVGEYYWSTAPAGWRRAGDLQRTLAHAINTGAGTANAVQATSDVQFSTAAYAALVTVNFATANTGAMTLAINGETPRPLVTNTGAAIPTGYITAGMSALVQIDNAGNYRLFSYGDASAIQAAAEAAQASAEAARDAAEAAAAGVNLPSIVSGDAGKQLVVKADETGYELVHSGDGGGYSPLDFGIVDDPTLAISQTAAVQAMLDAVPTGAMIDFGRMSIKCSTSPVTITKDIHFVGRGARLFFDSGSYLKAAGTISSPLGNIATSAVMGSAAFKASTSLSAALAGAKLMILHKHITGSLNKQRSYYYDGEFQEPLAVSGSTVICTRTLDTTYAGTATDEIYRVDPIVFTASGITFEADDVTSPWAVWLRFCWKLDVDDCQFIGGQTRSLYVDKCYKGDLRRPKARHITKGTGTGYAIGFGNSQDITVHDPDCHADNHAIAMGGNDENGSAPCRRIFARGNGRLSNQSATQSVVDIHGNAVDCGYEDGLTLDGAAGLSGHRTFVRGCKIKCRGGNAPFYLKEVGGGFIEFSDNEVWYDARQTTVTITNASPAVITWPAHSLYLNHPVAFSTTGALPAGITAGTTYYVSNVIDGDTFTVSATISGAEINTTDAGSGTHTCATVPSDRIMGFTSSVVTSLINEDVEFIMDRNKIHSHAGLKYGAFMYWTASRYVDDNNLKPEINWHIRANDNRLVGPITGLTAVISMTAAAAPTPWTYTGLGPNTVTFNDIKTDTPLGNTVNLAQAVSGSFGRTTYTLPEFAISGTITIPSGGYQSGNITLDHPIYPGVPECAVSGARGFSGANLVDVIELTATTSQRVARLALASTALTVSADYARNIQVRVGMRNRKIG